MSKFVPFVGKIHIEPLKQDTILVSDDANYKELGKVISVGSGVDFVKKGDILAFSSWGCDKVEHEGETYHVVGSDSRFIIGKFPK